MPPAELPPALNLEPYPGLRCFEPHEDFLFYGREIHTAAILDRLSKAAVPRRGRNLRKWKVFAGPRRSLPLCTAAT